MKEWTLEDLGNEYNMDLDKAIGMINESNAKMVLIQFPDGLKQYAKAIVDYLEDSTGAEFVIFLGSCFGACDTPVGMDNLGFDLMIQFGHNSLQPSYLTN